MKVIIFHLRKILLRMVKLYNSILCRNKVDLYFQTLFYYHLPYQRGFLNSKQGAVRLQSHTSNRMAWVHYLPSVGGKIISEVFIHKVFENIT